MNKNLAGFRVTLAIFGSPVYVTETYSVYVDTWRGTGSPEDARNTAVELAKQRFPAMDFRVGSVTKVYHPDFD